MGLFRSGKTAPKKPLRIFIVEDSKVYASQLEFMLQSKFGESVVVSTFPVAEVMEVKLEHNDIPDLIIMDHFLNARYDDAEDGSDVLQRIKKDYPKIRLVLHTSASDADTARQAIAGEICHFVPKGTDAFDKLAEIVAALNA